MNGVLPICIFSFVLDVVVIGIFFGFIGGCILESTLLSSVTSVVDGINDDAGRVQAMSGGSRIIVFPVISVFRVVGVSVVIFVAIVIIFIIWNVFCLLATTLGSWQVAY